MNVTKLPKTSLNRLLLLAVEERRDVELIGRWILGGGRCGNQQQSERRPIQALADGGWSRQHRGRI